MGEIKKLRPINLSYKHCELRLRKVLSRITCALQSTNSLEATQTSPRHQLLVPYSLDLIYIDPVSQSLIKYPKVLVVDIYHSVNQ